MKRLVSLRCMALLGVLFGFWSGSAIAATLYNMWEQVTLDASTGASCGNGTPYRFYVNRSLRYKSSGNGPAQPVYSKNLVVASEGGGACWDYASCTGNGMLGASNPNGIPDGYTNVLKLDGNGLSVNMSGLQLMLLSPIISRLPDLATGQSAPTADWNYVFLPYCTGDIHGGSAVHSYTSSDGRSTRIQQFAGQANVNAALDWLKQHGMSKPDQLLVWGASAGGYGSTLNYASIRTALQPGRSALFNDAGTIFPASLNGNASQPSRAWRMYSKSFDEWNFRQPGGAFERISNLTHLSANSKAALNDNPATIYGALSQAFPSDRMGLATYQLDGIIAEFTYDQFYPEIANASSQAAKQSLRMAMFTNDLGLLVNDLKGKYPNFGYFMPAERGGLMTNHTVSTLTFVGSEINGNGQNVGAFLDDLVSNQDPASKPVMQAYSTRTDRPWYLQLLLSLLASIQNFFA
ncbi:pectin acetylesterase-family hydrolase [Trinickia sp. YCB016]